MEVVLAAASAAGFGADVAAVLMNDVGDDDDDAYHLVQKL